MAPSKQDQRREQAIAPTEARLLDAQAMQALKEVVAEFALFNSAASGKADSRGKPASMVTSLLTDAVNRPHADAARAGKPQQRAELSQRILSGSRKRRCCQAAPICSNPVGRLWARWSPS